MKILRAVGLGLAIVIIKLLMPETFSGFEGFLTSFFGAGESIFTQMQTAASIMSFE